MTAPVKYYLRKLPAQRLEAQLPLTWKIDGGGGFIGRVSLVIAGEDSEFAIRKRPLLELTDLYVHPLRRGRGWAQQLIDALLAVSDKLEADVVLRIRPYGTAKVAGAPTARRLGPNGLVRMYTLAGFQIQGAEHPTYMVRRYVPK